MKTWMVSLFEDCVTPPGKQKHPHDLQRKVVGTQEVEAEDHVAALHALVTGVGVSNPLTRGSGETIYWLDTSNVVNPTLKKRARYALVSEK